MYTTSLFLLLCIVGVSVAYIGQNTPSSQRFGVVRPTTVGTSSWLSQQQQQQQQQQESRLKSMLFMSSNNDPTTLEKPNELTVNGATATTSTDSTEIATKEDEKPLSKADKLLKQIKDAGTAGTISYALWELAFWFISIPVVLIGYREVTGHWPNLSDGEDVAKLSAEAFAFVNFARFAVPLRLGLALSTTPWIQDNIVEKFFNKKNDENESKES